MIQPTHGDIGRLLERIRAHILIMDPHQKTRVTGKLLLESASALQFLLVEPAKDQNLVYDAQNLLSEVTEPTLSDMQAENREWTLHNFGPHPSWQPLLGIQEEVGELSHAVLKRHQGIRNTEDHDANIRDAVADIVIYLLDFCNTEGLDLQSEVASTWARVRQRDWKARPQGPEESKT